MDIDFMWIGLGLAAFGYFIGDGLKNFRNPVAKSFVDSLNEDDEHELIKESEVHHFMGVSKEDAKKLIKEHPDIPHLKLNGHIYYPKSKLRKWLMEIGD